jgi:hypothetical protein
VINIPALQSPFEHACDIQEIGIAGLRVHETASKRKINDKNYDWSVTGITDFIK